MITTILWLSKSHPEEGVFLQHHNQIEVFEIAMGVDGSTWPSPDRTERLNQRKILAGDQPTAIYPITTGTDRRRVW